MFETMIESLGGIAEGLTVEAVDEVESLASSIIAQIGAFVRMVVSKFIDWMRRIYFYLAENPLFAIRAVAFICALLT